MNEQQKMAWSLYMEGKQYKQIADELDISIHTLKAWQKKFKWKRLNSPKKKVGITLGTGQGIPQKHDVSFNAIRGGLLEQLEKNNTVSPYYVDLVNDYMAMWNIKNNLILDIQNRGELVEYKNGANQWGVKKNDSVTELIKYNAQMLNLLDKLGLKATAELEDDDIDL